MGDVAKVIALDDVRASQKHQALRQQLHERFDQWLDALERQLPAAELTLHQVSETIWGLRQPLTASVAQTIVEHRHQAEHRRTSLHCATCERLWQARPTVRRTVETLVGASELERPYCYCRQCQCGRYPLDEVLGLRAGRRQRDVQQAAVDLATE